jgi:predicted nuclease with TOPRIM domain
MLVEKNRKPIRENYEDIRQTTEEMEKKINEIIERLTVLGYGQEIIFDELQELKDLYTKLSKKTWGQLLKGKLIDLVQHNNIKMIHSSSPDASSFVNSLFASSNSIKKAKLIE